MSVNISDPLSWRGLITASIRLPVKKHQKSQMILLAGYKYSKLAIVTF